MKVVIIKYNSGNVRSVSFALERLGIQPVITDDSAEIKAADKVIFPGVGEASSAMAYLKDKQLDKVIISLKQPVLGICLGMQLLCSYSEENDTPCLGVFHQQVKKFKTTTDSNVKTPQIGWNTLYDLKTPLFKNISEQSFMYFVHGYYVDKAIDTIATTDYILSYSAALQKNNFYAVQFHPEKSSNTGEVLLENFLSL